MKRQIRFVYILLIVLGMALFCFLNINNTTVPYDDAYSVFMIKKSYINIIKTTALDVHPPLYYWGLKTFSIFFGDSLFTLRMFSAIGVLATLLLGRFPIRRLFGDRVAIFFMILTVGFPVTQFLATDIRMYSWTMFFVLSCAIYAYQVYTRGRRLDWLLFFVTSICAAYLHYYGLLSVLGIYLCLLTMSIINKKKWKYTILCGILFSIAYLPWLIQLVSQINTVSDSYWIRPLTLNDLYLHIYYFYSPKEIWLPFTDFTKNKMIIGLVLVMIIQSIITLKVIFARHKRKDKCILLPILAFSLFLFPIFLGFLISIFCIPISVTRYMTCPFGFFALGFAFVLAKAYDFPRYRKLSYLFLSLILILGVIRAFSNMKYYKETEDAYKQIRAFAEADSKNNTFVVNDFSFHIMPRLQVILQNNRYIVLTDTGKEAFFEPFDFEQLNENNLQSFILVHQDREAVQNDFRKYWSKAKVNYIVIDSLHAADIHLYKIETRPQ